jgi:predicted dehydrogenase
MGSLTVGIVGLGTHGRVLMEYLREKPVDVVGIDASSRLRSDFGTSYEVRVEEDFESITKRDLDAIFVTLPNSLHEVVIVKALEEDIDVFVEKPLCIEEEALDNVLAAERDSEGCCMVDFAHRHIPEARLLKHYVAEGTLGDVDYVHAQFTRRRSVPAQGSWLTSKEIAGGGVLMDLGILALDMVLWLFGHPDVTETSGTLVADDREYAWTDLDIYETEREIGSDMFDVERKAVVQLTTDEETTATIETAWANEEPNAHGYRVQGSDGAARLGINDQDDAELQLHRALDHPIHHVSDESVRYPGSVDPLHAIVDHFFDVVRGDAECEQRLENYRTIQSVVRDVYRNDS